jgi:hypothetical protein
MHAGQRLILGQISAANVHAASGAPSPADGEPEPKAFDDRDGRYIRFDAATVRSRAQKLRLRSCAARQRARELRRLASQTRIALEQRRLLPDNRAQLLRYSAQARLLARMESMPVIEQAKGVLMVQSGCSPDEAFDLLRRASQRANIPVRELAAQIVARTARS